MTSLPQKLDDLERVADLHLKSYKPIEIARKLDMSPAQVKKHINDYGELMSRRAESDPNFLERVQENTIEALQRMDNIVMEAWETYETAKDNDMINQQINLLKVAGDLEDKRAKLLQLMGAKLDNGMLARMNKAERVNEIVSRVIKDIVSECDHCKIEVMPRLAEAFSLMDKPDEIIDMEPVVEEKEEEREYDHEGMMSDILAPDS
jgi:hypothetical protein